ncbi:MAG: type I restriction endonuclease [Bacteroidota bacterium]|nr:type I restriction endonuclease [Bacteroidota bacterium]
MDFKDQIKQIGDRVNKIKDQIQTEEATKTALVMPFIQCLGYDIFNPSEVVPEFISDIGTKKGEKIDYAIFKDGHITILIECKHWNQNLSLHDNQLLRYFHVSKSKFGVLTNGIIYRFYSDLVEPNKMDEKPFLEFDITDIRENEVEELKKFHKSYFNIESIVTTASELKYTGELKLLLNQELNNPTENFVKHFAKQVYPSVITAKVLEQFTALIKKSIHQYISDLITDRLKAALNKEVEINNQQKEQLEQETIVAKESNIETTVEEMEGFYIVKAILRQRVDGSRIVYRDAQTYFSILLDDNNRKTICRLHLNGKKKFLGIFNDQRIENKVEINTLDEIYKYSTQLLAFVEVLEK